MESLGQLYSYLQQLHLMQATQTKDKELEGFWRGLRHGTARGQARTAPGGVNSPCILGLIKLTPLVRLPY